MNLVPIGKVFGYDDDYNEALYQAACSSRIFVIVLSRLKLTRVQNISKYAIVTHSIKEFVARNRPRRDS